jgi:hypothetical protein
MEEEVDELEDRVTQPLTPATIPTPSVDDSQLWGNYTAINDPLS